MKPYYLILLGLFVEIVGGFILASDAIGLDRVKRWATDLHNYDNLVSNKKTEGGGFLSPVRITIGVACVLGLVIAIPVSDKLNGGATSPSPGVVLTVWLGSVLASMLVIFVITVIVRFAVNLLQRLQHSMESHNVGVFGFVLLFLAFLLQFAGTLWDSFARVS